MTTLQYYYSSWTVIG